MEQGEENNSISEIIRKKVSYYYKVVQAVEKRAKEEGIRTDLRFPEKSGLKYENIYQRLFQEQKLEELNCPPIDQFLEQAQKELGVQDLVDLLNRHSEAEIVRSIIEVLQRDLMQGKFEEDTCQIYDINEKTDTIALKRWKEEQTVQSTLAQLMEHVETPATYWKSVLLFDSTLCYIGKPQKKSEKKSAVATAKSWDSATYTIIDPEKGKEPISTGRIIYNPVKRILKKIDEGHDLLYLFTTGKSRKDYLYFNIFGEQAYFRIQKYFKDGTPPAKLYSELYENGVEQALKEMNMPSPKSVTVFLNKIKRLKKIWIEDARTWKVRENISQLEGKETILILQSLLPLIDENGEAKSEEKYQRELAQIATSLSDYTKKHALSSDMILPLYGFADFYYYGYSTKLKTALKYLQKHPEALDGFQRCVTDWERDNKKAMERMVVEYVEKVKAQEVKQRKTQELFQEDKQEEQPGTLRETLTEQSVEFYRQMAKTCLEEITGQSL